MMPPSETQARMGKEETIWAAVGVLRIWIGKYGVPRALYTDWKNVYKRKATPAEQLRRKCRSRSLGACVRSWGFASWLPVRRKPRGEWSGSTGCIKIV